MSHGLRPGWAVLLVAAVAGFAVGGSLALMFNLLHSNWKLIPGVTAEATNTVPYWTVQFLGPVSVSVCWTALALHARSVPRWGLLTALALSVQLVILAVGLVPIAIAGNGGVGVSNFAQPLVVLIAVASPLIALFRPRGNKVWGVAWHGLGAAAFPIAIWLGQSLWAPQTLLI